MARPAEQAARTRLVAQLRGVRLQHAAGKVDPLPPAIGQGGGDLAAGFGGTRLVRPAQEEQARGGGGFGQAEAELVPLGLHPPRSVSASRVTMRSATISARFSNARSSAAIVAYSLLTTSIPASEPAVASSSTSPVPASTSW